MAVPDLIASFQTPVAILGMGVEGRDTFRFLRAHGVTELRVFDRELAANPPPELAEAGIPVFDDAEWMAELPRCATVVRSPGIRPDHPALIAARVAGAQVTSASTLFMAACPSPVIGVTGTLGKGTCATLIHEALRAAGIPARLAGNIGLNPLALLDEVRPEEPVVLELSSFQLMDLGPAKPCVAVILRISEDHLDWHHDHAEYYRAKAGILAPPGSPQVVIYCADAEGSHTVVKNHLRDALAYSLRHPVREGIGVGIDSDHLFRYYAGAATPLPRLERLALPGRFNAENAAAALLAAEAVLRIVSSGPAPFPVLEAAQEAIARFPGLPHRLERVGSVRAATGREVACYNDSYATRPDATVGALSAFNQPLALILGGSEKNAGFTSLAEAVCRHPGLKQVLLIGATAERLAVEITEAARRLGIAAPPMRREPSLPEACTHGVNALRETGGVLLLSPACASFGLFPNYKVRGEKFREWVQQRMASIEDAKNAH
jgi:UDP-N-acetylmuramoylalanine--D-glutamate ligase